MKNRIIHHSNWGNLHWNKSFSFLLTFWFIGYYRYTVLYTCYHFVSGFLGHVTESMADFPVIRTFGGCMHFDVLLHRGLFVLKTKFKVSAEGMHFATQLSNFYSHFGLWAVTGILLSRPLIISLACSLSTWLCTTWLIFPGSACLAEECPWSFNGSFAVCAINFRSWGLDCLGDCMGVDGPVSGRGIGSLWP